MLKSLIMDRFFAEIIISEIADICRNDLRLDNIFKSSPEFWKMYISVNFEKFLVTQRGDLSSGADWMRYAVNIDLGRQYKYALVSLEEKTYAVPFFAKKRHETYIVQHYFTSEVNTFCTAGIPMPVDGIWKCETGSIDPTLNWFDRNKDDDGDEWFFSFEDVKTWVLSGGSCPPSLEENEYKTVNHFEHLNFPEAFEKAMDEIETKGGGRMRCASVKYSGEEYDPDNDPEGFWEEKPENYFWSFTPFRYYRIYFVMPLRE